MRVVSCHSLWAPPRCSLPLGWKWTMVVDLLLGVVVRLGAFVDIFLARISKGHMIQEVINYTLTVPMLYSLLGVCSVGGASIETPLHAELPQKAGLQTYASTSQVSDNGASRTK